MFSSFFVSSRRYRADWDSQDRSHCQNFGKGFASRFMICLSLASLTSCWWSRWTKARSERSSRGHDGLDRQWQDVLFGTPPHCSDFLMVVALLALIHRKHWRPKLKMTQIKRSENRRPIRPKSRRPRSAPRRNNNRRLVLAFTTRSPSNSHSLSYTVPPSSVRDSLNANRLPPFWYGIGSSS